jgi:hypothetical protein
MNLPREGMKREFWILVTLFKVDTSGSNEEEMDVSDKSGQELAKKIITHQ